MASDFEVLIFIQAAPTSATTWRSQENHHPQEAEMRSWDHWTGHPPNPRQHLERSLLRLDWLQEAFWFLFSSCWQFGVSVHADNRSLRKGVNILASVVVFYFSFLLFVSKVSFLFLFCHHLTLHVSAFLISGPSLFLWPRFTGFIWNIVHLSQKPCLQAVAPRLRNPEWTIQLFQLQRCVIVKTRTY